MSPPLLAIQCLEGRATTNEGVRLRTLTTNTRWRVVVRRNRRGRSGADIGLHLGHHGQKHSRPERARVLSLPSKPAATAVVAPRVAHDASFSGGDDSRARRDRRSAAVAARARRRHRRRRRRRSVTSAAPRQRGSRRPGRGRRRARRRTRRSDRPCRCCSQCTAPGSYVRYFLLSESDLLKRHASSRNTWNMFSSMSISEPPEPPLITRNYLTHRPTVNN